MGFDPDKPDDMVGYFAGQVLAGMVASGRIGEDPTTSVMNNACEEAINIAGYLSRHYQKYRTGNHLAVNVDGRY